MAALANVARIIVHLDADAFFASVEQAADPRLRGKPLAVGGEKRGIIASASYEARKFGVYTPMPTARARKLCPKLIILPGDFDKYEHFSRWMFSYAQDFTPDVEIASIDEGYFDLTAVRKPAVDVADIIRTAIRQSLKISVSEGIASNKLVSQIASKLRKPAAFAYVPAGGEISFLHPLPNCWLPGIGPQTGQRLNAAGLACIRHVAATPVEMLQLLVGKMAGPLRSYANGIDDRPVVPMSAPAKSYSQQQTFDADITDEEYAEAVLRRMADELMAKVRAEDKSIRTFTVKVRYNDMAEDQCGESLLEPTDLETDLYGRLHQLFRQAWKRRVSLRMVSLKFSNVYGGFCRLELPLQRSAQEHEARRRLADAVDALRRSHGQQVILRRHDFRLRERPANLGGVCPISPIRPISPISPIRPAVRPFVHLAMHSYYSFLNSTLSIEAIVQLAKRHELPAVALTDEGNLHGAVEFTQVARAAGIKPIIGAELLVEGHRLRVYVENAKGYANLCRLLSLTPIQQLEGLTEGLLAVGDDVRFAVFFPGRFYVEVSSSGAGFQPANPGILPANSKAGWKPAPLLAGKMPAPLNCPRVAVWPVRYAQPTDRWKFDVVQSIRTRTLLRQAHPEKVLTGEFHFRPPAEMSAMFRDEPELLAHTTELAERCAFELPLGAPQFPAFACPDGSTSHAFLRKLVLEGLRRRYHDRWTKLQPQVEEELNIIREVGYEDYFLVVWDILQECRQRGIDWITRGSAADSMVCYCLGISDVCPIRFDLDFRRFLNKERMQLNKLPDIDVDFPHDRKDDVVDLIFEKYGAERAAVVGGFSTFQARSAVADVAKVLGVSEHQIRRFTEHFPWTGARGIGSAVLESQECRDLPLDEEPYKTAVEVAAFLDGVPRYPKMHPCGVVLSRQPMSELTPTFISNKGYPTTHFDMDAVEAIGLVKIDILAQGGLAVMRDAKESVARQRLTVGTEGGDWLPLPARHERGEGWGEGRPTADRQTQLQAEWPSSPHPSPPSEGGEGERRRRTAAQASGTGNAPHEIDLNQLEPWEDSAVWEMIARGGGRAVHHIESPAMVGLCRQSNVRDIDGLIAIVSVIRPGAANEQKKLKFTRRYQGLEPVTYPHPSLERCLKSTFGLVVYEEHILQICEAFAGLAPGRADVLRRALGKQKQAVIEEIRREFMACARARGHPDDKIVEVWELVSGFAGYAFCKAHSTAYGVEAYQSAWLKRYHPVEFMAAVLSNGKGFYHPLVYVLECHRLGIPLLPPSINQPGPMFTVERQSIRVPLTRVKGLTEQTRDRLVAERQHQEFASMSDFYCRAAPTPEEMEAMIRVGAFDCFGKARTAQFWEAQHLARGQESRGRNRRGTAPHIQHSTFNIQHSTSSQPTQGWLFPPAIDRLPDVPLQEPTRRQCLEWETELLDFAVRGHPLELHSHVAWDTYCSVSKLGEHIGEQVVTCGLIIEQRTHHQVTGEPMKFLTLADWTGMVETELFAPTYRSYGLATVRYPVLEVTAMVEPFENGNGFSLRVHRAGKPRVQKC